ncbi:MAG: transforming growth factor-beta-induced protein, partial [Planctomycetota bacterium]
MKRTSLSASLALCLAATSVAQTPTLDLTNEGQDGWQTVLDGVMGGRSSGRVRITPEGTVSFAGKLSLENNGGFSQMRRQVKGEQLANTDGLVLEVRGDGRTYNFDIRVANARMMAGGFQQQFKTVADKWVEVTLPFEDFQLQSFGRIIKRAPKLNPSLIESVGVTLSDKKPGDFQLELRSIKGLTAGTEKAATGGDDGVGNDLVSVAKSAGLTTLLDLVTSAKLKLPESPVTIFAPTNEAFAAIPKKTLEKLLRPESRDTLRQILMFHIVPGLRSSDSVLNARSLPTLSGQPLTVDAMAGRIAGAGIAVVDVPFEGGVVHVINKVMMPEQRSVTQIASSEERLATLMTAVNSANLAPQFDRKNGPWTIFAPVDSAFAKLPASTVKSLLQRENVKSLTQILGLHVVRGRIAARELLAKKEATTLLGQPLGFALKNGKLTIGENSQIIQGDIQASNGVIHLIDTVLLPPQKEPAVKATAKATSPAKANNATEEFGRIYALAVERGAKLFNDGNPDACAAIYEVAVETMIGFGGDRV